MPRIAELFASEQLRLEAAVGMGVGNQGVPGGQAPGRGIGQSMPGQQQQPGQNPNQQQQPQQDSDMMAAPYVKLLTKLGYEFQGADEDVNGQPIGQSFQGQDGDMILVKQDGSWVRFGPGAQRNQGPDVKSLGNDLVSNSLQQGDDKNHHSALRQAGYQKIHKDDQGNTYYKHPQSGKSVTVKKDGSWGSSQGTGRGAGKLRDFLGNEQMEQQDPQMQKMKLQQQQMKQQGQQQQQPGKPKFGTQGLPGTRQMRPGRGGGF
jgi:hypothetical protein